MASRIVTLRRSRQVHEIVNMHGCFDSIHDKPTTKIIYVGSKKEIDAQKMVFCF